jgi:microcystin-dependent protein
MSGFTNNNVNIAPPIGSLIVYAGTSSPSGWLLCDGTSYSTTTYANLFNVIGYTYGGSGGNFNIPDLRNLVIRGCSSTSTITNVKTGSDTVTLAVTNLPAHTHQYFDAAFAGQGGSNPSVMGTGASIDYDNGYWWRQPDGTLIQTQTALLTSSTGSNTPFNIIPSNLAMNYIIKF